MQVVYSPGQPHTQTTSTDNLYQPCHGVYLNTGTSLPLHYIPLYPPPGYTEGTHFMPGGYLLEITSEHLQYRTPTYYSFSGHETALKA